MTRLIYESSLSYKGFLVIPFVFGKADNYEIYSYKLLAEAGYKSQLHKVENPAGIYGSGIDNIIDIAKEHLDKHADFVSHSDYFKTRYVYKNNLIVIYQEEDKYFYDHYPQDSLNNIAAPKIFSSAYECIAWIKQGLDASYVRPRVR